MSATFYLQSCPTCGRPLRVYVHYLGRHIQCRHCGAVFTARDPGAAHDFVDRQAALLRRVDAMLEDGPSHRERETQSVG